MLAIIFLILLTVWLLTQPPCIDRFGNKYRGFGPGEVVFNNDVSPNFVLRYDDAGRLHVPNANIWRSSNKVYSAAAVDSSIANAAVRRVPPF